MGMIFFFFFLPTHRLTLTTKAGLRPRDQGQPIFINQCLSNFQKKKKLLSMNIDLDLDLDLDLTRARPTPRSSIIDHRSASDRDQAR
jgi:hypothetical protein